MGFTFEQVSKVAKIAVLLSWALPVGQCVAQATSGSSTEPAGDVRTLDIDLTFTERSPLSAPKELARRLVMKETEIAPDYNLGQLPFKAYVPVNYDAATPVGIFVYLGYKNSVGTPPAWHPVLDKNHMIFITPVCHSGDHYQPSVPMWESMGLALDAAHNLKKLYSIDPKRIYMMSWDNASTRMSLSTADVFTGFVVGFDPTWCHRMNLSNNYFYAAKWGSPPPSLFMRAMDRPFFLVVEQIDDLAKLKMATMRREGFHATTAALSIMDDLHYPNFKADWFEQQALPYLDKIAMANRVGRSAEFDAEASTGPLAATTEVSASSSADTVSPAKHLLNVAQLFIKNNQPELAKAKLQEILDQYPNDVDVVEKAKALMAQLDGQ
jgi:hypothetical protein